MKTLMSSVFILNLSYTGLGIARSFAGTGIRVYGMGSNKFACGRFSKYLQFLHCPDSSTEKDQLCELLISLAMKETQRPIIFPTRDYDVIFLKDYEPFLEKYFVFSQPDGRVLDLFLDKWKLYKVSLECQVPTPKTVLIENLDELKRAEVEIGFPALLKPVRSSDWRREKIWEAVGKRKAIYVESRNKLWNIYRTFSHILPEVLLQEYVEGGDNDIYTFCSYRPKDSSMINYFNTQKVRQYPAHFGTGIVVKSVNNDALTEPSLRLLEHSGFWGISEIEYKRDPTSGKYYMIEINPRFWDQHSLSLDFGLNLPMTVYSDLVGERMLFSLSRTSQSVWIAEDSLIQCLLRKLSRGRKELVGMLHEIKGKKRFAIWSIKDPLPFLFAMLAMIVRTAKQELMKLALFKSVGNLSLRHRPPES